jgi:hypothetical protein
MTTHKPVLYSSQQANDFLTIARACFAQEITGNGKRELFDRQAQNQKIDWSCADFP